MKFLLVSVCLAATFAANAGELDERRKIHQAVSELFHNGDFETLEELAQSYRIEESRTPSGTWKLAEFYDGLTKVGLKYSKDDALEWVHAAESIDKWIDAFPDSPTPYVAKGAAMMNRGWAYRGEGWSSSVGTADGVNFKLHAYFAANFLVDNYDVGSKDPHWYYLIVDSMRAFGAEKDEILSLADEGLDRHLNYDPLYFKMSGYLSPKWRGSFEELEAFAQEAVKRTEETRGYELYARIYWAAGKVNRRTYAFQRPEVNWNDMISGMDDVVRRYPAQWNINHFARFACYRRDFQTTRKYLQLVEEPVSADDWEGVIMNYQKCRLNSGLEPSPNIPMPTR